MERISVDDCLSYISTGRKKLWLSTSVGQWSIECDLYDRNNLSMVAISLRCLCLWAPDRKFSQDGVGVMAVNLVVDDISLSYRTSSAAWSW